MKKKNEAKSQFLSIPSIHPSIHPYASPPFLFSVHPYAPLPFVPGYLKDR